MILIDSYYINIGGGKVLLDYLINTLVKQNIKFNLIVDARNKKTNVNHPQKNINWEEGS